ncbi:MAG: lipoate--protein ligase family protein [Deltaproteobacteria bacterium]|nr:lipoate--protein ligase family protein [Deltaproteobacteria bacterium]
MRLHRDRFPGQPVLDTAVSHALLRRVARGDAAESLRLYRPDDALLFSSLDARRPGYAEAVARARAAGFEPVVRLAGGHAAVFLASSLAFAWASPDPEASLHIRPRFERLAGWIVAALRRLGLDARLGEVEGEYCPGEFSVNLGGRIKVMGVGQRVIRGGAHVGGVVTIAETERLRAVLVPIYEALELEFRPETAGGLADAVPGLTADDLVEALSAVLRAEGIALEAARFDPAIEDEARALCDFHAPDAIASARGLRSLDQSGQPAVGPTKILHQSDD